MPGFLRASRGCYRPPPAFASPAVAPPGPSPVPLLKLMKSWLAARWQAFLGSFDPDEAAAKSTPISSVRRGGAADRRLPGHWRSAVAPASCRKQRRRCPACCWRSSAAYSPTSLIASAAAARWGALATLLDNGFYAASLSLAAVDTTGGFAIGFAVVQALIVMAFPASFYGFSLLMVAVAERCRRWCSWPGTGPT